MRISKNIWKCSNKHETKPLRHELLDTLQSWITPEVPTGPETSPVDTAPIPILFITLTDL